ncbi:MAG: transcriptional repressor [Eubacterium sp.]|nr:transcriptional repressor [Eubacterium sp.]
MTLKAQYKTKQRAELTAYLISRIGQHVTVADMCRYFEEKGKPIGVTTIYRQLDKMVSQGLVNKYVLDNNSSACYEYVAGDEVMDKIRSCYHCKCEKCGKLIHLQCEEIEGLINHIEGSHSFKIDYRRTVFYGLCENCRDSE